MVMSRLPGDFFYYFVLELLPFALFRVIALCKSGHQKLVIKISGKLLQLHVEASDLASR